MKSDSKKLSNEEKFNQLYNRVNLLREKIDQNEENFLKNFSITKKVSNESSEKLMEIESTIKRSKEEIASFTFQLITIIMGIFTLILSIMFLWVNSNQVISDWLFFYQAILVFFIVVLSVFVYTWIAKNFHKPSKYAFIGMIVLLILFIFILFYEDIITSIS